MNEAELYNVVRSFSATLRRERLARKLIQKDVSNLCGIAIPHLFTYEAHRQIPTLSSLVRWADALDYDLVLVKRKS